MITQRTMTMVTHGKSSPSPSTSETVGGFVAKMNFCVLEVDPELALLLFEPPVCVVGVQSGGGGVGGVGAGVLAGTTH